MTAAQAPQRVALQNIGCKLNHYEVEALKQGFGQRGYQIVPFGGEADIYVVNTCTVTGAGDADSRKAVRRARRANPQATVVATGCYAQRRPDELRQSGADLTVGNGQKAALIDHLEAHTQGLDVPSHQPRPRPQTTAFLQIDGLVEQGRTRGTLQIQDGCDEHCTYCIIPTVRGPGVSRPIDQIVAQARQMATAGYRELALTGVHSGSYGHDQGQPEALVDLLQHLERVDGLERIRLNSIEPAFVSDALIDYAACSDIFCRHFHIPLQSGDDHILKRMGRHYTRAYYAERVERIVGVMPDCCIGADVMVGFPGESEAHFAQTQALISDLPMAYLHVFPFSLRSGTPAQRLAQHQDGPTKRDRTRRLIELSTAKRLAFHQRFVGRTLQVLIEERHDRSTGLAVGLSDNYIKTLVDGPQLQANSLLSVRIGQAREDVVFAQVEGP
ncbi:MAG: tRNA (N(6)-L-threonylcarbamoyladenosine(37)-C(2))-methylthiotransferase MtaB [Candidatus Latescibacteria bacterium]|nr:tRNA (N(6)-L-threonylcarbamoyladenosine(37)-C(2))-methylthiotransferase MtaB [Candidatus Latescibacterota bacterium]